MLSAILLPRELTMVITQQRMGDSDCSYDFGEAPRFLDKLEEGYDFVMGNRFAGGIMLGAMPWHHRYIGNPILSGIGRFLYRTPCRDWHCGLRAFNRAKMIGLGLKSAWSRKILVSG